MKNLFLVVAPLLLAVYAGSTDVVQVHGSQINPLCTITAASFVGPLTGPVTGKASTCGVADSAIAVSSTGVTGLASATVSYATTAGTANAVAAANVTSGNLPATVKARNVLSESLSQLASDIPTAVGAIRYCSDCSTDVLVVSTQTVTASWASVLVKGAVAQ